MNDKKKYDAKKGSRKTVCWLQRSYSQYSHTRDYGGPCFGEEEFYLKYKSNSGTKLYWQTKGFPSSFGYLGSSRIGESADYEVFYKV